MGKAIFHIQNTELETLEHCHFRALAQNQGIKGPRNLPGKPAFPAFLVEIYSSEALRFAISELSHAVLTYKTPLYSRKRSLGHLDRSTRCTLVATVYSTHHLGLNATPKWKIARSCLTSHPRL